MFITTHESLGTEVDLPIVLNPLAMIAGLRKPIRLAIIYVVDVALSFSAAWLALFLRFETWRVLPWPVMLLGGVASCAWLLIASRIGVYQSIIRFSGPRSAARIALACVALSVVLLALFMVIDFPGVPRTAAALHPIIFLALLVLSRVSMRGAFVAMLQKVPLRQPPRRVLVFGAGRVGRQLVGSLNFEPFIQVVGFVDDNIRLHGRYIDDLAVWNSAHIDWLCDALNVSEVLLAIPNASRERRREIVAIFQDRNIRVRSLQGMASLIQGRVSDCDFDDVRSEDVLGRETVSPDEKLMIQTIAGQIVLVSGAGGSIGGELCRQIVRCKPSRLILVEQSEYALYAIELELRETMASAGFSLDVVPLLANVSDRALTMRIFEQWRPDTVFHAAAYKHVPLVESNPVAAIGNNVFSTLHCSLAADAFGAKRFILVSTDKAVRPTSLMGASKRVCELIVQGLAVSKTTTVFTMVRFGNVLGSSGSVVPLFRAQIARGGPVTITHRDVTRYLMTIPEASQLVIQAASIASGGEVFVLDMGEPVRILDLAKSMIRMSGLTVRDADYPHGDIEITEVGLRPGEKMFEELLIGADAEPTPHARILRAKERMFPWSELSRTLSALQICLNKGDIDGINSLLIELVPEYAGYFAPVQLAHAHAG